MQRVPDTQGRSAVTTKRMDARMSQTTPQTQPADPEVVDPHATEPPLTPEEEEEVSEEPKTTYELILDEIDDLLEGETEPYSGHLENFYDEDPLEQVLSDIPDEVKRFAVYEAAEALWGCEYDGDPRDAYAWRTCLMEAAQAVEAVWETLDQAHWNQVDGEINWLQERSIDRPRVTRVASLRTWRFGWGYVDEYCRNTFIVSTPWTDGYILHLWTNRKKKASRLAELRNDRYTIDDLPEEYLS